MATSSATAAVTHVVRFEPNGVVIACGEDESVGAAAKRAGLRLFLGCERGGCGICRARVEGEVVELRYSRNRLTDEDRARGVVLACRVQPRGDLVVRREDDAPFPLLAQQHH